MTERGSAWIIANAGAGTGMAPAVASRLAALLAKAGHRVVLRSTRDRDMGIGAAREAIASGAAAVIACGGDGTVSSVHSAVVGTDAAFGIVPSGSGDDIAAFLGFDGNLQALAASLSAPTRLVDVGVATCDDGSEATFLGVMSSGFDSAVNERANTMPRLAGQRYRVAMARELATFRPIAYRLTIDGVVVEVEAMLIAVGNGDRYGNGMRVCPASSATDGLLDVTVLRAVDRLTFVRLFPSVYSGGHVDKPSVDTYRGRSVRIEALGPSCYADGERVGLLPVTAQARPGALRILAPVS